VRYGYRVLLEKIQRILNHKGEDDIKEDFTELQWNGEYWIYLVGDRG
jgi:hypothetical protein